MVDSDDTIAQINVSHNRSLLRRDTRFAVLHSDPQVALLFACLLCYIVLVRHNVSRHVGGDEHQYDNSCDDVPDVHCGFQTR